MDAIKLAARSLWAAHKFLFWALVEWATQAIYWHKEASREQLILRPRRPADLYDNGYALFAYDVPYDTWLGHWRFKDQPRGTPSSEVFDIQAPLWGNVPFHEVEFSDMPEITFRVRAVSLEWCRANCAKPAKAAMPEASLPLPEDAPVLH